MSQTVILNGSFFARMLGVLCITLFLLWGTVGPAHAVFLEFSGSEGGTVSYAGGANPIMGTALPIDSVSFGSSFFDVVGAVLDYTTGVFDAAKSTASEFIFTPGGTLTITADGSDPNFAGLTLLSAGFGKTTVTFDADEETATLTGRLTSLVVDSTLATALGFPGPFKGRISQVIDLDDPPGVPGTSGASFSGEQDEVSIQISPVPEPASLFLVGSGLVAVGIAGRRWLKGTKP